MSGRLVTIVTLVALLAACGTAGRSPSAGEPPGTAGPGRGSPGVTTASRAPVASPSPDPSAPPWTQTEVSEWGGSMTSALAFAADDVWAAGTVDEGEALITHWDGRAWREVAPPVRRREVFFRLLAASSRDDLWVFSDDGRAWRWTGTGWAARGGLGGTTGADGTSGTAGTNGTAGPDRTSGTGTSGAAGSGGLWLRAAAVAGPRDVWTAGTTRGDPARPFLGRWDGSGWSEPPLPPGAEVNDLGALSPRDVWAVGRSGGQAMIMHWAGERWDPVPAPPVPGARGAVLDRVLVVSPDEAWALGTAEVSDQERRQFLLRWDGSRWREAGPLPQGTRLTAVESDGHGGLWAGGESRGAGERTILHFDGAGWTYGRTPGTQSGPVVNDLARSPDGDLVVAVGGNPDYDEDSEAWVWTRH
ncbi:hypothetical protein ACQP10_36620 [Streptosporangium sandarakinum]|uniref:hypothetical protein n=1 Tax=Streptosporangium sandarakinum TaxID=1260955 RepID=UPI003D8D3E1B